MSDLDMSAIYRCLACGKKVSSVNQKQICRSCVAKEPEEIAKASAQIKKRLNYVCKKCNKQVVSVSSQDGFCKPCHAQQKRIDSGLIVVERILEGEKKFSATAIGKYWDKQGDRQFIRGKDLLDSKVKQGLSKGILKIIDFPIEKNPELYEEGKLIKPKRVAKPIDEVQLSPMVTLEKCGTRTWSAPVIGLNWTTPKQRHLVLRRVLKDWDVKEGIKRGQIKVVSEDGVKPVKLSNETKNKTKIGGDLEW